MTSSSSSSSSLSLSLLIMLYYRYEHVWFDSQWRYREIEKDGHRRSDA